MKKLFSYNADNYYIKSMRTDLFTWGLKVFIRAGSYVKRVDRGWFNHFLELIAAMTPEEAAELLGGELSRENITWA